MYNPGLRTFCITLYWGPMQDNKTLSPFTNHLFFSQTGQQQSGVLADLCLAWQQRRVLSCGSTESLMCWERWGERICRSDLEKPAGIGRSIQEGDDRTGWGGWHSFLLALHSMHHPPPVHICSYALRAHVLIFKKHAYHYHWSWVIPLRDMIVHVWCGFENYSKAFIVNESRKAKTAKANTKKDNATVTHYKKKTLQKNQSVKSVTGAHLCHRQFCPWGPSPDSPARCPGSWGGPTLARCPPHRRPPQSQLRSLAGHSGPCHLVRSLWPRNSKQMRNESVISDEHEEGFGAAVQYQRLVKYSWMSCNHKFRVWISAITSVYVKPPLLKTPNDQPACTLQTLAETRT